MNGSGAPLVSVVVPAWNAADTLAETLRSVSAQNYANIEIIIVDDGSTDDTAAVAAEYCALEPRARLVRQDNAGVAAARNRAIAEAKGEWVAPIDSDDLWNPAKIEKQVAAALDSSPHLGFVYCWYHFIDDKSRVIGSRAGWVASGSALRQLAYENFVGNGSAALFARSAINEVGGYDPGLRRRGAQGCEDLLLQLLIAASRPVAAVPEYLVGYRVGRSRMSSDSTQMRRSWEAVFETLQQRGIEIPPRVARWALGIQMFGFAETSALQGRPLESLRLLVRGFRLDPLRCSLHLFYRLTRLAVRLVRGRRRRFDPVPFAQADPTRHVELDANALPRLAGMLQSHDRWRLASLRSRDQSLA